MPTWVVVLVLVAGAGLLARIFMIVLDDWKDRHPKTTTTKGTPVPDAPDLVTFLHARLDEDEAAARACCDINDLAARLGGVALPRWKYAGGQITRRDIPITKGGTWDREGAHIVRWDPARVLAEIAAKRLVIDALEWFTPDTQWSDYAEPGRGVANRATDALLAMAQPYAEHPDFDPTWKAE